MSSPINRPPSSLAFMIASCLILSASSIARADNLIANGSFESPNLPSGYELVWAPSNAITGWQTVLDGVERFSMTSGLPLSSGSAQDGLLLVDLNIDLPGGHGGGIQQSVPTTIGTNYVLTYYVGTLKDQVANGNGHMTVSAGGVTSSVSVSNFTNTLQWTQFSLSFVATSENTLISFQNFDPAHQTYDFLDNVSLAPHYNVCLLYDPTKAVHSGATVPIKLQLCDGNGNDSSSPSITLHAVSVTQTSSSISGAVQDSGNSNPDYDFRFDGGFGSSGGYIFNLKTTGLSTGTYSLNFTVVGDSSIYSAPFQVK